MRVVPTIFFIIVFGLCAQGMANNTVPLPLSPLKVASQQIDSFLEPGTDSTGKINVLQSLERLESAQAIRLIFRSALERLNQTELPPATRKRVNRLVQFSGRLVVKLNRQATPTAMNEEIKALGDQLLIHYRARSEAQTSIIRTFNKLELWSASDLWFALKFANSSIALVQRASQIREMIPTMSAEQLAQLATAIRSIRPYSIAQLSLLMDTGLIFKPELVILFKLAAKRFADRLHPLFEETAESARYKDRVDQIFASNLSTLAKQIHDGDRTVISAMQSALNHLKRQSNSEFKSSELTFFEALRNPSINWLDLRAEAIEPSPEPVPGSYRIEGNVFFVNFGSRENCEVAFADNKN